MTYHIFSRSETGVGVECPACKRVLKVDNANLRTHGGVAIAENPIVCPCGHSSSLVAAEKSATATPSQALAASLEGDDTFRALRMLAGAGILGLMLLFAGSCVWDQFTGPQRQAEAERLRNERLTAQNLAIQARFESAISRGEVMIGMSMADARKAWGTPNRVNTTTTADTVGEQWVYPRGYLYFERGSLVAIQGQ